MLITVPEQCRMRSRYHGLVVLITRWCLNNAILLVWPFSSAIYNAVRLLLSAAFTLISETRSNLSTISRWVSTCSKMNAACLSLASEDLAAPRPLLPLRTSLQNRIRLTQLYRQSNLALVALDYE